MANRADPVSNRPAWAFIRAGCRAALRRIDLRVEGAEHLPRRGPVVIAARHFHHLYDGCALLDAVSRPLHVVVALDWARNPAGHRLMTGLCRAAGWPIVPRPEEPGRQPGPETDAKRIALLRAATRECVALLRAGKPLLVFPEAYPTIDPGFTPKTGDDDILPFRPGFVRLAALAERDGRTRVPIVPAGLDYARGERWRLTLRFGPPLSLAPGVPSDAVVREVESQVRLLSGLPADRG